jgi:hypothetical protein
MKILALEKEVPGVARGSFKPHMEAEAAKAWELYQLDVFREIYFRKDRSGVVIILECRDMEDAKRAVATLPFVKEGLIYFEIMPLIPYPGFSRLFAKKK